MYRLDVLIDHVLCVTNSLELDEIAFRSTLTNNVRPLTRNLSRFRDNHNLPILRTRIRKGISFCVFEWWMCPVFYLSRRITTYKVERRNIYFFVSEVLKFVTW